MTIENIIKKKVCVGCGTCAGICPTDAIEMKINESGFYVPKIDKEKCIHCEICNKVCPQIKKYVSFKEVNKFVFDNLPPPENKLLGNLINCYIGHSEDENLRFEASSGGMITQILIVALEERIIDGALVTRMQKDKPLIPEPFIARTKNELLSAMGSKYCPVPTNTILKEILNSKEGEKFAVVGLPCHIMGIRKAEMLNKKLQDKIVLHVGIFCQSTKSFFGTDFILKQLDIKKENVRNIKYRGKGWPGSMQINNNGKDVLLPFLSGVYSGAIFPYFANINCTDCKDHISFFSDISVGDPWGITKDPKGDSLLISRTGVGEKIIELAVHCSHISLKDIKKSDLFIHPTIILQKKPDFFTSSSIKNFGFHCYNILFSKMPITKKFVLLFITFPRIIINYKLKVYLKKYQK